jgi:hypothetical protein
MWGKIIGKAVLLKLEEQQAVDRTSSNNTKSSLRITSM